MIKNDITQKVKKLHFSYLSPPGARTKSNFFFKFHRLGFFIQFEKIKVFCILIITHYMDFYIKNRKKPKPLGQINNGS